MARALLIHNPQAARTHPGAVRSICDVFATAGWEIEAAGTAHSDDAAELARQGVAASVDVIAVYGGDGTALNAMAEMLNTQIPLGLIRGGTGNLLAGNLRLPRNPTNAAKVIVRGVPKRIDLGRLTCGDSVRYFAVACGTGFDAQLMAGTTGSAKRRWGMGAYVAKTWELLRDLQSVPHRITVDGETVEMEAVSVMVANCGEIIPPFLRLKQGILLDDGLLDVVVLNANGLIQSASAVWQMVTGRSNNSDRVSYARGRVVTVQSEVPRPVELDGEPTGMTPFTAEVVPGGISVVLPRTG